LGDEEIAALCQFSWRALRDSVPKKVDMLYVYGQTQDNEVEPLDCAVRFFNRERTNKIAVPDQRGRGHPPHAKRWIAMLNERGILDSDIMAIEAEDVQAPNTETESASVLKMCADGSSLAVTASVMHLPRAFLTIVSNAIEKCSQVKVYAVAPDPGDWTQVVAHSQGETFGTRTDTIMKEIAGMAKYTNLVKPSAALAYLDARDRT